MSMTSKTVLIADDDHDLTDALAMRCGQMGLKVEVAYDARTAFTRICESRPDAICLDVKMPSGSGLSVCEMLYNDEELSSIPVIMLTGVSDRETIQRCHHMCAYYVLKSEDVWSRLSPILCELLGIELEASDSADRPRTASEPEPVSYSSHRSLTHLLDAMAEDSLSPPPEAPQFFDPL